MIAGIISQNLQGSINWKLDLIDESRANVIFCRIFNPAQAHMTCSVKSKYKRKNSSYVLEVFVKLCVESFVRSERCLPSYTHIELSRSRFTLRAWWLLELLHKELSRRSETFEWSLKVTSRRTYGCCRLRKEIVCGLGAITWLW